MQTGLVFPIILLGLDLEYRNPRHAHDLDARIAMLPLDARERLAEASHLNETERLDEFYRGWVRYEPVIKIHLKYQENSNIPTPEYLHYNL
ncbi:hypothetical protein H2O77_13875 [Cobetia sp. 4B]|uniref:hypothetical protein n=1 Tax=Cobetia sp. 4B TaxID=2758724 RepID=UPI001C04666C|nr:hypothetical protein [Cobetia sp. 4B]QWN36322.1 hypothetical protein H2O77_13875 [Cobetia sp. 4B]